MYIYIPYIIAYVLFYCFCCNPHRFVLGISNTRVGLTAKGRRVPFTKVAFGSHGSWCIVTDQLGTLYCFDIGRNK